MNFTVAQISTNGYRNISASVGVVGAENLDIKCPECGHEFEYYSPRGQGAQYVKDWTAVPLSLINMVSFWVSNPEIHKKTPKIQLLQYFRTHNYPMNDQPFSARISELLGLGLIHTSHELKKDPHDTRKAPQYWPNIEAISGIIDGYKKANF